MATKPKKKKTIKRKILVVVSDQNYRALKMARKDGEQPIKTQEGTELCNGITLAVEPGVVIPASSYFEKDIASKQKEFVIRYARLEWEIKKKKAKPVPHYYENARIGEINLRENDENKKIEIPEKKVLIVVSDQNFRAYCVSKKSGGHRIEIQNGVTLCYGIALSKKQGYIIPASSYFEKNIGTMRERYTIRYAHLEWKKNGSNKVNGIPRYYKENEGEEILRKVYEREKEENQAWKNGRELNADNLTPICVLSDKEYDQYRNSIPFEYLLNRLLKRYVRPGTHQIKTTYGSVAIINGYMVQRDTWFYVSRTEAKKKRMAGSQEAEVVIGNIIQQEETTKPMRIATKHDVSQLCQWIGDTAGGNGNGQPQRGERATKDELPKIPPSNQPVLSDTISNTNRIYLYSKKCHCSKCQERYGVDTIVDCRARVRTKKNELVPITVQFCRGCGHFFINYETYQGYNKQYGGLKFKCVLDVSYAPGEKPDIGFAEDSFLSRNGYSVSSNVPRSHRQSVLAHILDTRIATKHEIIEKITEFINLRRNNPAMNGAVSRWKEDIAFVSNYRIGSQLDVGEKQIVQAGTIKRKI